MGLSRVPERTLCVGLAESTETHRGSHVDLYGGVGRVLPHVVEANYVFSGAFSCEVKLGPAVKRRDLITADERTRRQDQKRLVKRDGTPLQLDASRDEYPSRIHEPSFGVERLMYEVS